MMLTKQTCAGENITCKTKYKIKIMTFFVIQVRCNGHWVTKYDYVMNFTNQERYKELQRTKSTRTLSDVLAISKSAHMNNPICTIMSLKNKILYYVLKRILSKNSNLYKKCNSIMDS